MENDKFTTALNETLSHEGGYSNHPDDRGGETCKGVSRKNYPEWAGWDIVDFHRCQNEPNELGRVLEADAELQFYVSEFYYDTFWLPLKLDRFDQLVSNEVFDTAVNQGIYTAATYLQQALNMLNNNGRYYSDIKVDGHIGAVTIQAYMNYMATANIQGRSVIKNIHTLVKVLNGLQFERYRKIVTGNPKQEVFFYGWINRIA